jgi:hypothetical protein
VAAGQVPTLTVAANQVRVGLASPEAGGPTAADLRLAGQIEGVG